MPFKCICISGIQAVASVARHGVRNRDVHLRRRRILEDQEEFLTQSGFFLFSEENYAEMNWSGFFCVQPLLFL